MTSPTDLTLRGALDALAAGDLSSEELARAHLDAIEALNRSALEATVRAFRPR